MLMIHTTKLDKVDNNDDETKGTTVGNFMVA